MLNKWELIDRRSTFAQYLGFGLYQLELCIGTWVPSLPSVLTPGASPVPRLSSNLLWGADQNRLGKVDRLGKIGGSIVGRSKDEVMVENWWGAVWMIGMVYPLWYDVLVIVGAVW